MKTGSNVVYYPAQMLTTIKTKNFILRPYKKEDEFSLFKNINDKEISRNMLDVPYPYSLKIARNLVNRKIEESKTKKPEAISFVIDVNGEVAGGITLDMKPFSAAELSIWLGKNYRGKGIATLATKLVTDYCFKKLKLVRVYALIFPFNKASIHVMEKAGYQCEGRLRKNSQRLGKGKFFDDLMYAKIRK